MKLSSLSLIILFFALVMFTGCTDNSVSSGEEIVPGELLATLEDSETGVDPAELIQSFELELLEYFQYVRILHIGVPEGEEYKWIEVLESHPEIKHASPVRNNVTLR